jgi:retron-type reverse transcriptase
MKRHNDLWERLTSFPNLLRAAEKACRGKKASAGVARFHYDLELELCRLQRELRQKRYVPGQYHTFQIFEPKLRKISAAPYRDRVVHHALCRVIEPVFERCFIFDSYACRRGKGTTAARDRFTAFARGNRFVLKCDIRKFFPSIDLEILKELVARKIKDPDVLWLANTIIDRSNDQEPVIDWYPGDDLFTPVERIRGLPIGNQTSQFFANLYLDRLDHFVKETVRCRCYLRYVDDFAFFSDDKHWLSEVRGRIWDFLTTLRLRLHPRKCEIAQTGDGVSFLGYRIFPTHRLLVRGNVTRFRRRLKRMQAEFADGRLSVEDVQKRLAGWIGHAVHADTFRLRSRLLGDTIFRRSAE